MVLFWSQKNTDIDECNGLILSAMCVAKFAHHRHYAQKNMFFIKKKFNDLIK